MTVQSSSHQRRYSLAVFSIVFATVLRVLLNPILGAQATFSTFYMAILLSAWYGGFGPGLVALVLGGLCANYFFMLPQWSFGIDGLAQQVSITLYFVIGFGIAVLGGVQRTTQDQLEARVLERTAELSRANDAFRASEERFRFLISDVLDYAIFTLDVTGHVTTWNAGAERNKGYLAEEIIGQHFSRFYPQEEIASGKPEWALRTALEKGRCEDIGWRMRKDGSRFWARVVILALKDEAGQLRGFAKITRDITETKSADERFRQAVESAPNGMVMVDAEGLITLVNAQTEKLFGYRRDELLGQPVELLIPERFRAKHPGSRTSFMSAPQVRSMGMGRDLNARRKDGSEFSVEIGLNPINTADGHAVLSAIVDITSRKEAEQSLRDRERFLRIVTSSARVGLVVVSDQYEYLFANEAYTEIFGLDAEQIVGRRVFEVLPQAWSQIQPRLDRALAGERVAYELTLPPRSPAIEHRWFRVGYEPRVDETGKPSVVVVVVDITERKRAEEELRESEERFRMMANSIPQLAWIAHADGSIFWYNQRWYDYTGTTLQQMEGWGWQSVHDPELLPTVMHGWTGAINTGKPFKMEFPVRGADGRFRAFLTRVEPFKDAEGRVIRWFGTNTDVDEMKRLEESLRAAQARLTSTLSAGSIGTWTWDIVSDRLTADEFTARMFSIEPAAAFAGLPAEAYLRAIKEEDQPGVADSLARAIKSCGSYDIEYRVRQNNGQLRWLHAKGRVEGNGGKATWFHGAVMDVTSRKLAESELHRLNGELEDRVRSRTAQLEAANKELEAFSYSVSHDLRAPLRGIDGFSRILLKKFAPQLPPEAQEFLNDVRANSQQMGRLVDDLLAFSQLGRKPVERRLVVTGDLVHECLNELKALREGRHVDIRLGDLPDCEADPALLKQVWLNLLANAIKYSGKQDLAVIEVGCYSGTDGPVYFVKDNGVGFDMRYAHKLFGVFQRLHKAEDYEGTGVGLAIVQRIINRHGGRVWAEAEPNKGATFFFTLASANHATIT